MIDQNETDVIKKSVEEFLQKMTILDFVVSVGVNKNTQSAFTSITRKIGSLFSSPDSPEKNKAVANQIEDIVSVKIKLSKDPQFLIGQSGQTLLDLQRILRVILSKKIKKVFYLKIDINDYQKQKTEYLKKMAKSLADEAVLSKEKKYLPPMSAHERRVVHEELAQRKDVVTESYGNEDERYVVITPQ